MTRVKNKREAGSVLFFRKNRRIGRWNRALILCLSLGFLCGCGWSSRAESGMSADTEPEYCFTYADNQPEDYPTTKGAAYFAKLVSERTNGRIEIRIYDNSELGNENAAVTQVEYGGIDFARVSLSTLTGYSEMVNVLMLPYIYRDSDHMWSVLDGEIGGEVMDSFDGSGIVPLSWYDAGVRNFYATREIHQPSDMEGMNIRVQNVPLMSDMVRSLGAVPVPLAYSEVYSALATGEVDGAENNWPSYKSMNHDEIASYYIEDEHMRIPELQIMSQTTLDKLSEEDREIIRSCAAASAHYEQALWSEYEEDAKTKAIAEGCHVITLTDAEKKQFRDAVTPLYEKYCGNYMDLVEAIIAEK